MKVKCDVCGKVFDKPEKAVKEHNFCCVKHFRKWCSERMTDYNKDKNPMNKKWTKKMRLKKREQVLERTGKGEKAYNKFLGRHEHRVVAERMLGRKLKKSEVVHHIDLNKQNNDEKNLVVLPSNSEHSHLHQILKKGDRKEYERLIKYYKSKTV